MGAIRQVFNRSKIKIVKIMMVMMGAVAVLSSGGVAFAAESDSDYVPKGQYTLRTTGGKYLAVDGDNVYISDWGGERKHTVTLARNSKGYYALFSAATGKALDISGASTKSGANVQMWDWNGSCAQRFAMRVTDSGYYTVRSSCNFYNALDVASGAVSRSGANVWSYRSNGSDAQKWQLVASGESGPAEGVYKLLTNRWRALDVLGGLKISGANVHIWPDNGTAAQEWRLVKNADGSYRLINPQAGKSLDVAGGSRESKKNVWLWSHNNTCAQKWFFEKHNGEYYILKNACGGMALDVAGGETWAPAKNVQTFTPNWTLAQDWRLMRQ